MVDEEMDIKFYTLVSVLSAHFGRIPTEDEVIGFIYGDDEVRFSVWNQLPFSAENLEPKYQTEES